MNKNKRLREYAKFKKRDRQGMVRAIKSEILISLDKERNRTVKVRARQILAEREKKRRRLDKIIAEAIRRQDNE